MPYPIAQGIFRRALAPWALTLALTAAGPARAQDWPMFQGDPAHSGIAAEALSVPMALEWKHTSTYYQNNPAAPVIAGDTLYFTSQSTVYAVHPETGELKWKYPETGPIGTPSTATIRATPVVANGTLYVGASDGVLYSIDAATGTLNRQFQTGGNIRYSPILADGVIYFGSDDNKMYALDAKTLQLAFEPIVTGGDIIGSPSLKDGVLYFTSSDLNLYAVNIATGRTKFRMRTLNANLSSTPIPTDRYIFTAGGNTLYTLMRSGNVRWLFDAKNPISNTPLVTEDAVYIGDKGGRLYALDLRGRPIWKITDNDTRALRAGEKPRSTTVAAKSEENFVQLMGAIYSTPVLSGENLFVGTNRGFLYAIDAKTGKVNWEYGVFSNLPAGSYVNIASPPVVANGRLYVISDDGALHCFSPNAVDVEKPIITAHTPVRSTEMNGTPPILMGAVVTDEGSGIDPNSVQLTLDGEPVEAAYQSNTGWVFYRTPVTQPVQPLSDGRHTVAVSVMDWKGNKATDSWTFVIDNKLATSVIQTPAATTKQ